MANLPAIEDSDQRLNTINTCIQPALKGRNRENLKMIGYVVIVIPKCGRSANQFLKNFKLIKFVERTFSNVAICGFAICGPTV